MKVNQLFHSPWHLNPHGDVQLAGVLQEANKFPDALLLMIVD